MLRRGTWPEYLVTVNTINDAARVDIHSSIMNGLLGCIRPPAALNFNKVAATCRLEHLDIAGGQVMVGVLHLQK